MRDCKSAVTPHFPELSVNAATNPPAGWLCWRLLRFTSFGDHAYIGIHFAIETLPPLFMTGVRFLIAGGALIVWARLRGAPAPTWIEWRSALIIGFLLFMIQNGSIVWAVGHGVPSGIVAVLTASIPLFMVLLAWGRPGGSYPGMTVIGGVLLGLFGIILLVSPSGTTSLNLVGVGAVMFGSFCWAYGSLYSKRAPLPKSVNLSTGMQLFAGGVFQMLASILTGDAATLNPANVSLLSLGAVLYLAIDLVGDRLQRLHVADARRIARAKSRLTPTSIQWWRCLWGGCSPASR